MADTKITALSPDEKTIVAGILEPLNTNPTTTEILNPLAKALRKKLGYAEPLVLQEDEKEEETDDFDQEDDTEESSGIQESEDTGLPKTKKFDDDDIDLDELLAEPSLKETPEPAPETDDFGFGSEEPASGEAAPEDPFAGMDVEPVEAPPEDAVDAGDMFGASGDTEVAETEQDPFAGLSDEASAEPPADDDMFGASGEPEPGETEADPFGDLGGEADSGSSEDPFAGISDESPAGDTDDMFGASGDTTTESDPFAGFGDAPASEAPEPTDDPFADMGGEPDLSSSADPFAGLDAPSPSSGKEDADDMFGASGDADAFGDLGSTAPSPDESTEEFHDPTHGLDDFSADLGTSEMESVPSSGLDDFGFDAGESGDDQDGGTDTAADAFEDDLSSLAQEDEPDKSLTDEELATIQQEIVKYPPKLKRTVIDVIVNDRIPKSNQKELLELIKTNQKPADIALFLTPLLGYKVELFDSSGQYSEDGVPIISTKPIYTKQGALRQRELIRRTLFAVAAGILLVSGGISFYKYVLIPLRAGEKYKVGLESIQKAIHESDSRKRLEYFAIAEDNFRDGEKIEPNSLKYLNAYGIAYMKAGEYGRSFEKLFGIVQPDFGKDIKGEMGAWDKRKEVPYISLAKNEKWDNEKLPIAGRKPNEADAMKLTSQDRVDRRIIKAGAYIVSRLQKNIHDKETYISLARFHSLNSPSFVNPETAIGKVKYKNDDLAINYYKEVFTDVEMPHDEDALAGIAKIYYQQKEFGKAASYYNKIIEVSPKDPKGHGGLLSTYIEMWKSDRNPQFVLNHHRQVRNALGIEKDLSIFTLTKLTSFYIDLDSSDVRIKYNINPEDQVTGMEIDDNVEHLLNIAFGKTEMIDEEEIRGDEFAEGYYQRGRYFLKKGETQRALKQFELAAHYDPGHYLAVLQMAEYYMRVANPNEAMNLLSVSEQRYEKYHRDFGVREEDETLTEGDVGRIFFDKGKIQYMQAAGITGKDNIQEFPGRKIYPVRGRDDLTDEDENRRKELRNSVTNFKKAIERNLKSEELKRELYYFTGWVEYMDSNYKDALEEWSNIGEEDMYSNPNLLMGKANSFYYTKQLNASLGNYMKIKDDFEEKEAKVGRPVEEDMSHQEIYQTLVAVYNNIGCVYEKKGNYSSALKYYWKAIETARKISAVDEIANANKDLAFKEKSRREPLLDDWLAPSLDSIREMQEIHKKIMH